MISLLKGKKIAESVVYVVMVSGLAWLFGIVCHELAFLYAYHVFLREVFKALGGAVWLAVGVLSEKGIN